MLTVKDGNIKSSNKKIVIGYDLSPNFAQISFFDASMDEPETVSPIAGSTMYNIPLVLAKRPGIGQWFYGREALKYSENEGILVDNLLERAQRGEEIMVEDEAFDPVALLALFIKRSLGILNLRISPKDVVAYMFTVEELDVRTVEVLSRVVASLQLKCETVTYQSHVESFYNYMIHQSEDLWQYQVMILEYGDFLTTRRFECTKNTKPEVVFITSKDYRDMTRVRFSEDDNVKQQQFAESDAKFDDICQDVFEGTDVTTVYLLGDGFKEQWPKESLKTICRNRRVFQGNNLYCKGACYAMMDKINPSEVYKSHVFLGEDKVKANVGLKALRRGEDSYLAILDAGSNWFEAKADFEIILDEGNEIGFVITSLTGGHVNEKTIVLDGLPERPRGTTRLAIHIEMSSVNTLELEIEDLGFGQIIKSSGRAWTQTLNI